MKRKILKISFIICIMILIICISNTISNAASFEAYASSTSIDVGETFTITIKANNAAGNYEVTTSNSCVTLVSGNATEFLENGTTTLTYKAVSEGTVRIVAKATDMTDSDNSNVPVNGSIPIDITITTKNSNSTPTTPDPTPTPEEPTKPTVTEPTFTSTNKTMYTTGDINLRSSWSTSSSATKVEKDTELTVTGTSTDKVNGYVWYRVSYNGQTKYVASNLLTATKPEENEEEKSNANLKSLVIEGISLSPSFSAEVTQYSAQVGMDINKLEITAKPEVEKASVKIEGNETLLQGENTVKIIVTAEDGTTKTYTINVTKQEEIFGLASLIIKDTDISDSFQTNLYEYEIEVGDIKNLEIEAIATDEEATVEILGNEDLQEGENLITIIVKSKDETQTVTYQIKVTKKIPVQEPEKTFDIKYVIYAIIGGIALIALIVVVIYTIKRRNIYNQENIDDFEYYPEDLPEKEEDEYYPEDLPKKIDRNYYEEDESQYDEEYEENEEEYEANKYDDYYEEIKESDNLEEKNKRKRGKHF